MGMKPPAAKKRGRTEGAGSKRGAQGIKASEKGEHKRARQGEEILNDVDSEPLAEAQDADHFPDGVFWYRPDQPDQLLPVIGGVGSGGSVVGGGAGLLFGAGAGDELPPPPHAAIRATVERNDNPFR